MPPAPYEGPGGAPAAAAAGGGAVAPAFAADSTETGLPVMSRSVPRMSRSSAMMILRKGGRVGMGFGGGKGDG